MIFKKTVTMPHTSENMSFKEVFARSEMRLGIFLLGLALIGCGRCVECAFNSGGSETICESEFDSVTQYNIAVDNAEASGATCAASGGGF